MLHKNKVVAYCDGSCSPNPGRGGIGVVILFPDDRMIEISHCLGPSTNNRAEIIAVDKVLDEVYNEKVTIFTDSVYAIGVLTKNHNAIANMDLIAAVREKLRERKYNGIGAALHHVKGHSKIKYNERADRLAKQAVRNKKSTKSIFITNSF